MATKKRPKIIRANVAKPSGLSSGEGSDERGCGGEVDVVESVGEEVDHMPPAGGKRSEENLKLSSVSSSTRQ